MLAVTQPLGELEEMNLCKKKIADGNTPIYITGAIDSQKCHLFYDLTRNYKLKLIVTYNEIKAKEIYEDYIFFDKNVYLYPARDLIFFNADIHSNDITAQRLEIIKRITNGENITVIATIDGCLDKLIPIDVYKNNTLKITVGEVIKLDQLKNKLIDIGYERTAQVEAKGQFSIRGGIIDIYSLTEECAYRIELWDEEVDSIRTIDIESQRSIEKLQEIFIFPAVELIISEEMKADSILELSNDMETFVGTLTKLKNHDAINRIKPIYKQTLEKLTQTIEYRGMESYINYFYKELVCFVEYFKYEDSIIILDEPTRITEKATFTYEEFRESMLTRLEKGYILPGQIEVLYDYNTVVHMLSKQRLVLSSMMPQLTKEFQVKDTYNITVRATSAYNGSFDLLLKDLVQWKNKKNKVLLLAVSRTRAERLAKELMNEGFNAYYSENLERPILPGEIMVANGSLHKGFEYPLLKFIIISETDVFGKSIKKKKHKKVYSGKKIQSFTDLIVGDYVVHEKHGLGIYKGIDKIEIDNVSKDYIKIEYSNNGNLFVPTAQLDVIQKYIGAENRKPKLNKLGSGEWEKTKTKVKIAVKQLAFNLVELYAKRHARIGFRYTKDTVWQHEFEEMFPYDETEDQILAINATKKDMESSKIMDRLICGDVGYGKTEVAIRAAFKAVQDGKQVAYLVPTTILAQQHYNTFVQRMKDFPIRVDMLSRFRSPKEQKKTLEGINSGRVDIVIGTHRILSKDLKFKDLGLLIIDEEQRFGVGHKEKMKNIKSDVDVLTLTATPIPRTLHMSLIGIRDMSVLEEPPEERQPIQTYVLEHNDELIREAINRELAREGQIYYVYNRVNKIEEVANNISRLVPDANVAFAHGQMKESELEKIMFDFINGDIDVLVSTTIIETGLDISNVNTMIIHDADQLGLAQLYQLRGRVGRSNRTAYAYLMYKSNKMLKEVAEKRLQAIREFTELGSGFKIAMRDLEIRGTGNLLGAEQHGSMEAVGYDMYCKMLDEAVRGLKDEPVEEYFETTIDLNYDAYIPNEYIKNEFQKLDVYKRIATIELEDDFNEMQEELEDRFGTIPTCVQNLLDIAIMKSNANKAEIIGIEQLKEQVKLFMKPSANIDASKIPDLINKYKNKLNFTVLGKPFFALSLRKISKRDAFLQINTLIEEIKGLKL